VIVSALATAARLAPPVVPAGTPAVTLRTLGMTDYGATLEAMRAFNRARDANTTDQVWLTEHPPVYTLGLAGRREHLLATGDIPVVASDRGGQVTYHGPGQLVAYLLLDLGRRDLKVRQLVELIEGGVIETLGEIGIAAHRRAGMPGGYVDDAKIAALGLKVSRGCTYHGMSLNVDCDLAPFARIDPCGYRGLRVARVADLAPGADFGRIPALLTGHLLARLAPSGSR
jgi:lipoyl(octanoyl) transferase